MDAPREIEHYRVRWDVKPGEESTLPLGKTPEQGRQLEEWEELSERLADHDPRIEQALEEQRQKEFEVYQAVGLSKGHERNVTPALSRDQDEGEAEISFRRVGGAWALRAPGLADASRRRVRQRHSS